MQFEYTPPQTEIETLFGGFRCINAFGRIMPGDDERFIEFLAKSEVPPRTNVYINSGGGDVEAALNIGRIIRESWFSTVVGQYLLDPAPGDQFILPRKRLPGQCMSAATLVYLGGRLRFLDTDSKFGVHQFSFLVPSPENLAHSQILSAKIARFVQDMGIGTEFLELSAATPHDRIDLIELEKLEKIGVVTGGQTKTHWSIHAMENTMYVRGERDNIYGHHKMLLGFAKPNFFYVYAVIESQGREQELVEFPLTELVIGQDEDVIIDISDRCERAVQGIYTNIYAQVTVDEARSIASSNAFGIRVRGSPDAELFLGVGPMSTDGGIELLKTFVSCLSDR
ncbi:hypothetical protein [Brucella anthropi]|uniref:hypothetical protein n=1 Tax=Brucella anthropi TaxID=529 RepID=UPI003D98DC59